MPLPSKNAALKAARVGYGPIGRHVEEPSHKVTFRYTRPNGVLVVKDTFLAAMQDRALHICLDVAKLLGENPVHWQLEWKKKNITRLEPMMKSLPNPKS